MKKLHFLTLLLLIFCCNEIVAQQITNGNLTAGTNTTPFNASTRKRVQQIFKPSFFAAGNPTPGIINRVYFRSGGAQASNPRFSNFQMRMGQTPDTAFSSNQFIGNLITVIPLKSSYFIQGPIVANDYVAFDLEVPFVYDPTQSIVLETQMDGFVTGFSLRNSTVTNVRLTAEDYNASTGTTANINPGFGFDITPFVANDLSISSLNSPISPFSGGTSVPVSVNIRSLSSTIISSANVSYQLNNNPVVTSPFTGSLTTGQIANFTFPTNLVLPATNSILRIWVSNPNGLGDGNTLNDTLTVNLCGSLAGTFTVGTNAADYPNLAAAFNALNCGGIGGPVTFQLQSGTHQGNATLNQVFNPQNYSLTITSLAANADSVLLLDTSSTQSLIRIVGNSNVNISNISLQNFAATSAAKGNIDLAFCENVNISDVKTYTDTITNTAVNRNIYAVETPNLSVTACEIYGGFYGLYSVGKVVDPTIPTFITGLSFTNNLVRSYRATGLLITSQEFAIITNNQVVNGIPNGNAVGISITRGISTEISQNFVTGFTGNYAISVSNANGTATQPTRIVNNVISGNSISTFFPRAIWIAGSANDGRDYVDIYHNSIRFTSVSNLGLDNGLIHIAGGTALAPAYARIRMKNNTARLNNAAANFTAAQHPIVFFTGTFTTDSTEASHNNYFYVNPNNSGIFRLAGVNYNTVAAFNAFTGLEANTLTVDPQYANDTLLTLQTGSPIVGLGTPVPTVTFDIQGSPRNAILPTIGAYEVQLAACNPPVGVVADSISYDAARIAWSSINSIHRLEYGLEGFTPGTGTIVNNITQNEFLISGLLPFTCYDVYVRDSCGVNTVSSIAGPITFCTLKDVDLDLVSITDPLNETCGDTAVGVSVIVRNLGEITATNFAVTLNYTGSITGTLTTNFTLPLAKNQADTLFVGNLNLQGATLLNLTATAVITNDRDTSNDSETKIITVISLTPPTVIALNDTVCEGQNATLIATGAGNSIAWFDGNNNQIATGDTLITPPIFGTTTFSARGLGSSVYPNVGAASTSIGIAGTAPGGSLNSNSLLIQAFAPVKLTQALVYPQQTGWIVIQLRTQTGGATPGTVIATDSVFVTQTISLAPVVIFPNLEIPIGSWQLGCLSGQSAGNMRINIGGASNPYVVPGVISVGPGTFGANSYYYFYNMTFETEGCPTAAVPRTIFTRPTPSASFTSVITNNVVAFNASASANATSFSWNFGDGNTGTGVTTNHTYSSPGTYSVVLTVNSLNCGSVSDTQSVTISNVPNPEIEFIRVITPTQNAVLNVSTQVSVLIKNNGSVAAPSFSASYSVNNGSLVNGTVPIIGAGDSLVYTFGIPYVPTGGGSFTLCAFSNFVDINAANDTSCVNFSSTVSVEEQLVKFFSLFPNPSNGILQLDFETNGVQSYRISILEMNGKVVQIINIGSTSGPVQRSINIENLADGIYMLRLESEEGQLIRKFVKKT